MIYNNNIIICVEYADIRRYAQIYADMRRYTQIHVDVICSALHSSPIVLYLWTCNIITPTHLVPTLPSGRIILLRTFGFERRR